MPDISTSEITIDLAGAEDADRILELNRTEFGGRDLLASPADIAWRLRDNPAGRAVIPVLRDASGQVVGYICMIPLHVRVKRQDRNGATGTNLVIHPNYRNGLAFTRLIRRFDQACREQEIMVHFSFVSEALYRQSRQHRPDLVSTLPLLFKILKAGTLAGAILRRCLPRSPGPGAERSVESQPSRRPPRAPAGGGEVRAVESFDDGIDKFWETVRDHYPAMVVRDRSYLEWRFGAQSKRDYRILVAETGDGVSGYLVQRCARYQDVRIGLIMDFMVAQGSPGEAAAAGLLAEAEHYFRGREASLITALCPARTREYRALRRARFRTFPGAFSPRKFRLSTVYHGRENAAEIMVSADQWFATLADWEAY